MKLSAVLASAVRQSVFDEQDLVITDNWTGKYVLAAEVAMPADRLHSLVPCLLTHISQYGGLYQPDSLSYISSGTGLLLRV